MYELIRQALDGVVIDAEGFVNFERSYAALQPVSRFLERTHAEWFQGDFVSVYVAFSVNDALKAAGYLDRAGRLGDGTTAAQRDPVAQTISNFWASIPITYEFIFPLPEMELFDREMAIAEGIVLKNVTVDRVDSASLQMGGLLSGLMELAPLPPNNEQGLVPSLSVESRGLMRLERASETPAAKAMRTAKITLQLAFIEHAFIRRVEGGRVAAFATYTRKGQALPVEGGRFNLPPELAAALGRCELPVGVEIETAMRRVSAVLEHSAHWRGSGSMPKRGTPEFRPYYRSQVCSRIATAAEWLFDTGQEAESAMAFVQTAIGLEALYGGGKEDAVTKTIANRLSHSLATTAEERELLQLEFTDFYDTRSRVVHDGISRLNIQERRLLSWGKGTLGEAIRHELSLVGDE